MKIVNITADYIYFKEELNTVPRYYYQKPLFPLTDIEKEKNKRYYQQQRILEKMKPDFDKKERLFKVPNNYYNLKKMLYGRWVVSKDIQTKFKKFYTYQKKNYEVMSKYHKYKANDSSIEQFANKLNLPSRFNHLYPYQKIDAYISSRRKSYGNFNTMRSGKTITTCASLSLRALNSNTPIKVLISILQPTYFQWLSELEKTCPEFKVFNLAKKISNEQRQQLWKEWTMYEGNAVILINKDKVRLDVTNLNLKNKVMNGNMLKKMDYGIIVDEAHFLRNKSQVSTIHFLLAKHASFRLILTGTKIANKGVDLYGIFKFLYPKKYKAKWDWIGRYFKKGVFYDAKGKKHTSYFDYDKKTFNELKFLLYMNSIERNQAEVLSFLPNYVENEPEILPMNEEHKKLYLDFYKGFDFSYTDEEGKEQYVSYSTVVAMRTKLLQAATMPHSVFKNDIDSPITLRLVKFLEDNPEKIPIVFGRFSNSTLIPLANSLTEMGYKVGLITGKTTNKSEVVTKFQNGEYDLLVANIQVGGTGLTLSKADTIIFIELSDNVADNLQASKRFLAVNKDDKRVKEIHTWLIEDSMSMIQWASLSEKQDVISKLMPEKIYLTLSKFNAKIQTKGKLKNA